MAKYLIVKYDVTDLTSAEIDQLTIEAVVQGERSKPMFADDPGHPDVHVTSEVVVEDDECEHKWRVYEKRGAGRWSMGTKTYVACRDCGEEAPADVAEAVIRETVAG